MSHESNRSMQRVQQTTHTHTHIDYLLLLWTASHAYSISTTANKSMEMFEMSASVTEHRSKLLRH